jgi:hypothetical protein
MRVQIERAELWFYYDDWNGYGKPDFDVEIPDDLYNEYEKKRNDFLSILQDLRTYLKDD